MKDGLLERIRELGHWRINFRPVGGASQPILLEQCRESVETSRVSIRGWDFPHISHNRPDGGGGYNNVGDHVENWTDWSGFKEFWRMYKSTQFLSYVTLREDVMKNDLQTRSLNILSAIYSLTEFFEFAHRLHKFGFYKNGLLFSITLRGMNQRSLDVGPGRVPFFDAHTSYADEFEFKGVLDTQQLQLGYRQMAVSGCLNLFDQFGWNPASSQIEADQERFYQRSFL